jgi:hypothetical protein
VVDVSVRATAICTLPCRRSARRRARAATRLDGGEVVAFVSSAEQDPVHNTNRDVGRGNILVWEQPLAARACARCRSSSMRMDAQSILYTTLWLFGTTFLAVAVVVCAVIWWGVRRGRTEPGG